MSERPLLLVGEITLDVGCGVASERLICVIEDGALDFLFESLLILIFVRAIDGLHGVSLNPPHLPFELIFGFVYRIGGLALVNPTDLQ